MISTDTPDLVLKELRDKAGTMRVVSVLAFLGAGIIAAPLLLFLKRLGVSDLFSSFFQGVGLSVSAADLAGRLLIFILAMGGTAEFVQRHAIPWMLKLGGESYDKILSPDHFASLTDADAVYLKPIVKASQPAFYLVKVRLNGKKDGWVYYYNWLIKYAFLLVSFGIVYAVLSWLVGGGSQ